MIIAMMQSSSPESPPPTSLPASVPASKPTSAPTSAPSADDRRKQQSRLSAIVAVIVACVGAGTIVGSIPLGYWTTLGPGPGFFPLWLGVLLAVLGAAWFLIELRSGRAGTPNRASDGEDEAPEYSLPTAVAIVVSLVVLATCLEVVGYQLSMLLFLFFHLRVLGKRGLLLSVVIAALGSFGVFVAFTQLLGVPLPASTLPLLRGWGL